MTAPIRLAPIRPAPIRLAPIRLAPVRLAVDLIACDGRGLCAELLPELITLDDWGYPLLSGRTEGAVPAELRGDAAAAVQLCPRLALRLESAKRSEAS